MNVRNRKKAWIGLAGWFFALAGSMWPLGVFGQDGGQQENGTNPIVLVAQQPEQKKDAAPPPPEPPPAIPPKELPGFGGGGVTTTSGSKVDVTPPYLPPSGDTGGVLANIDASTGVEAQRRSPLSIDPRIRGYHIGEVISDSDGAFWTAARIDLDTALGAINPDDVQSITVIKGPYSVRYGPGFAFLDVTTLPTPRSKDDCFEAGGSTSVLFKSNGDGWAGRQSIWGGGSDWGFRLGYSILSSNDYHEGGGTLIPSAYNSQNVDFAFGFDLSKDSHIEIKYLRQMQNDVDYPGLLTDITQMNTDGGSIRYIQEKAPIFDKLTVDAWYNTTSFAGDSSNPSKRVQIPELNGILIPGDASANNAMYFAGGGSQVRLDLQTQDRTATWGVREAVTWGQDKGVQLTAGADLTVVRQQYNEFDSFNFAPSANLGIPASESVDPGLFVDGALPIGECFILRAGGRVDFASADIQYLGFRMDPVAYTENVGADAFNTQHYLLGSGFLTAEEKLTDKVTLSGGYGFAQRPPLLTELYTGGAFFGLIQNGFNAIYGNPDLSPEQLSQFDLGLTANYDCFRASAHGFYSLVNNYITYENYNTATATSPAGPASGPTFFSINAAPGQVFPGGVTSLQTQLRQFQFKNTRLAQLTGFEVFGEYDLTAMLTPFALAHYVSARDEEIGEPLPGIPPLEAKLGIRLHDPDKSPKWAVEFAARIVAAQDDVASSLGEVPTGGFTVYGIRSYWQVTKAVLLTAGVDNLTDHYYQEHLDLRTGLGVYQPGINFYAGMRVEY